VVSSSPSRNRLTRLNSARGTQFSGMSDTYAVSACVPVAGCSALDQTNTPTARSFIGSEISSGLPVKRG
jgi:hypothetical protein